MGPVLLKSMFGMLVAVAVIAISGQVQADRSCPIKPRWNSSDPAINLDHVFCGEARSGSKAAGFHARPGGQNPGTVIDFDISKPANDNGVYAGMATFDNPNGRDPVKFSSIFPDSCTRDQIVASISYAFDHQNACPPGAPGWWHCGPNRPKSSDGVPDVAVNGFCIGDDPGSRFTIVIGLLRDGRINTAFPLRD
ncbi:EndoU domain-containing protein [Thalassospira australica]|uniref:EndoU domain-containing protein n=1 Tax=Thalassospira australica TaxID=1528106 RepID=UPI000A986117|nr:EndoU domain-containing protein [Thalassospira australica]